MSALSLGVAIWLFVAGLYGIVTSRNLVHLIISLSVAQASTGVVLITVGYRRGGASADPVIQAILSSDVVVGAAVTALLLAVAVQVHKRAGTLDPEYLRRRPEG